MFRRADCILVDDEARRGDADIEEVAENSQDAIDKGELSIEDGGNAGQRAPQTSFFPRSFTLPAAPPLEALSSDKWAVGRLAFQALGVRCSSAPCDLGPLLNEAIARSCTVTSERRPSTC